MIRHDMCGPKKLDLYLLRPVGRSPPSLLPPQEPPAGWVGLVVVEGGDVPIIIEGFCDLLVVFCGCWVLVFSWIQH